MATTDEAPGRPRPAGTGEPAALLATKLHLPSLRPDFLPRARLADRLTDGLTGQLTLVCAPAGFGKTALLADWARGGQVPVAWLSLDAGDNDPTRFWRHTVAAVARLRPEVGEQVTALLDPSPRSYEAVVTAMVNELAAGPDPVVLVLDDYHLIEAAPVHDSVGLLLRHLPSQLRLILASRADPPLGLARLRAGGQLAELRERDLRFTPQETTALLRETMGLELPEDSEAALAARTEGWVTGLHLAALSLRGHADPAGFVASFTGSHRHVLDFLTEEVLGQQPDHLMWFLLQTSVRWSGSAGRYLRRLHLFQAAGRCQPAVPVSPKPNRLAPASRFTGDCPAEAGAHTPIHGRFSGLRATPGDHKQRRIA
jgi:LuxR family transcriptional regulator, maltose regulon positive regulatory protein